MSDNPVGLYPQHIKWLTNLFSRACQHAQHDGVVIHSGAAQTIAFDDNHYPHKVTPYFKYWLPLLAQQDCYLIIVPSEMPKLLYFEPIDFWHKIHALGSPFWRDYFDVEVFTESQQMTNYLAQLTQASKPSKLSKHFAFIGPDADHARRLGFVAVNPEPLLNFLDYHRGYKSDYEIACLTAANGVAQKGHRAAKEAFDARAPEFLINLAYLEATQHRDSELPYNNIIALNQHAAILHYTETDHRPPLRRHSMLIDAGASYHGYAADITRTYSTEENSFSELIDCVTSLTLNLIEDLCVGKPYLEYHQQAHLGIASIIRAMGFSQLSEESLIEQQVTRVFFPHGLGHFLGLQVHDVGGHLANEQGVAMPAPTEHRYLRLMRTIETGNVFTIEPGFYFIPTLLEDLRTSERGADMNWSKIEAMMPFGGVRIEDDVVVSKQGIINLSRA